VLRALAVGPDTTSPRGGARLVIVPGAALFQGMCVNLSCVAAWARHVAVLCCVSWSVSAWAQLPAPPEIAARSYLLMDVSAGQVLAQQQADVPVEPASLTKLMSAYIVFNALKSGKITLQQTFPVSQRAWKMPGSRMFIDPKMQVPVEDLLKGMIVQSGNDAPSRWPKVWPVAWSALCNS